MVNKITLICSTCLTALLISIPSSKANQIDLERASLDTVWQTVLENHYDSTFGGVDWQEVHDRYSRLIMSVEDDSNSLNLMNAMLRELKLSHYAVFRVDDKQQSGMPLLSEASIGVDLRLFGPETVISSVDTDFPAAQAGIKPGYVVDRIHGTPVQKLLDEAAARHIPYYSERRKISDMCDEVVRQCFGQPGDSLTIAYKDGDGVGHDVTLKMKARERGVKIAEEFPTVYVDLWSKRLNDDIGYIFFSAFVPPVDSLFLDALEKLKGVKGLIIDIRGNPGGMHEIGEVIASKFISEKTLFSVFRYRDSISQVILEPDPPLFEGPVAILIDVMNASASERFSACMQSIGKAKIIGEQSSGAVGPSDVKRLPNGASFMYLVAQSLTPDGTVLEGRGVIPDIVVPLDRTALVEGRDTQIERAITYLENETN